jgi:hypothetical protein
MVEGRWKPYDESFVYFYGFVRRGSDGVFVNIFEIRGVEIFGKGRGYDFRREALCEPRVMILKGWPFLKTHEAYKDLQNILPPWTARGKDDALPCAFVDSRNM